jgi:hypothetical protein
MSHFKVTRAVPACIFSWPRWWLLRGFSWIWFHVVTLNFALSTNIVNKHRIWGVSKHNYTYCRTLCSVWKESFEKYVTFVHVIISQDVKIAKAFVRTHFMTYGSMTIFNESVGGGTENDTQRCHANGWMNEGILLFLVNNYIMTMTNVNKVPVSVTTKGRSQDVPVLNQRTRHENA